MLLKTVNLTKYYGHFLALDKLNIEVREGEIYGFVGPNGAGKTTAMKILACLMNASAGEAYIDGISIMQNPAKAKKLIGYMPDFFGVYDNLKVDEYLEFYADAHNVPKSERAPLIEDLLQLVNLSDKKDKYVDTLSRGMKQRLCLARSLIHDPKLLILDEPASGMDPQARAEMKFILKALKAQGKSILISSHILPELSEMCDRVCILSRGKSVVSGNMDEIMEAMGRRAKITIGFLTDEDLQNGVAVMRTNDYVGQMVREGNKVEAVFNGTDEDMSKLIKAFALSDVRIVSISKTVQSLEQIFLEVIGNEN
jgi:ABC-2 type transport system ATP-binding protein